MDWRDQAICRDAPDADLWFPVGETGPAALQIFEAKNVCRHCPVLAACGRWALDTKQLFGIWGGMTEGERDAVQRRIARTREKARAAEKPAVEPTVEPVEEREPARVDGLLVAAPVAVAHRLYQERSSGDRLHAVMVDNRSACGAKQLDVERRLPAAALRASFRCRTKACQAVFTVADQEYLAVSHG